MRSNKIKLKIEYSELRKAKKLKDLVFCMIFYSN